MIEQLILEFQAKAQEEVTAVRKAHALCKRQNTPIPDEDPKRSLYEADTDVEETSKKQMKPTPASTTPTTTKPPPSAAASRASKSTSIDEVKGLDDNQLDYDDDVEIDASGGSSQMQEPPKDEKLWDSEKHSDQQHHSSSDGSTEHQDDGHPDHKKSRGRSRSKSRSRSPHGSCSPPP